MGKAALSMFCFGIYLIILGLSLMVIPNVLLSVFALPAASEVWIRALGMVVLLLGYIYVRAGRSGGKEGMPDFYRWTVHTRSSVIVFLAVFAILGLTKPVIILFGVFDLAGAVWTYLALRTEAA